MLDRIDSYKDEIIAWRRDLHQHPELAFQETRTADFVAEKLTSFGIPIHRGLGRTGVVGTLKAGNGNRAIALRADMDALPMQENNTFAHRSKYDNRMHACGHDGHTAMLLAAAKYLAETKNFNGTVNFIFQPAEEAAGGARVMIEDGLFEKFPVEAVYGMHNMPGIPAGTFSMRVGAQMAAFDSFDIVLKGTGTHAAIPHLGTDQIVAAAAIVTALQTIVARELDPMTQGLLSITRIKGGDSYNIMPEEVVISGCVRSFDKQVQEHLKSALERIVMQTAAAHRTHAALKFLEHYPPTISTEDGIRASAAAAIDVVGAENVNTEGKALLASEDFGYMLAVKPGSYIFIGNGVDSEGGCMVHNPHYDFNDRILTIGAKYWVRLVERELAA